MRPAYTQRAPAHVAVLVSSPPVQRDQLPAVPNASDNGGGLPAHLDALWHYECIVSPRPPSTSAPSSPAAASMALSPSTVLSPDSPVGRASSTSSSPVSRFAPSPHEGKIALQRVFNTFDENGDGSVSTHEISRIFEKLGLSKPETLILEGQSDKWQGDNLDEEEFQQLYESISCSSNSFISMEQSDNGDNIGSGSCWATTPLVQDDRDLLAAFHVFDKDGNGFISAEELQSVLCSLGFPQALQLQACKDMIARVDYNGDGLVDFLEFRRMFDVQ